MANFVFNPDFSFSAGKGGGKTPKYNGVPKTGQTLSYAPGDDGDLQKGVPWPDPRFTDNGDGTVKDNLTGLVWTKNASLFGVLLWQVPPHASSFPACEACNTLNSGEYGLLDGSVEGDWRLPNIRELQSLIDYGRFAPALPPDHPFVDVQSSYYWSSTTYPYVQDAWGVDFNYGFVNRYEKIYGWYVWCVRDALP